MQGDASGAPAMNFNTTNSTFRQLMGNGLSYRVPLFQRDYSCAPDEWDDLWQDIVALFDADPEPAHYMGYLVLQSADNRAFDIIDGQQRMTTLSLMMLAAISHLSDLAAPNDPADPQARRAEQLRASYIGYLDPVSLVPRSKLTLNRHNETFYQDYLVPLQRLPQRGLNASEHLLRRAFSWFKERIRERSGDDGTAVASFVDAAVDKLFFTVITVTDELNAFKVFETLNARGVRLSTTDLLKNYLFSVVARGGTHPSVYNQIATAISEQRIAGPGAAIELLRPVYPADPEFRAAFADKTLRTTNSRNRKVARFLLFQIEQHASGSSFDVESAKYDLEHVLPENPGDDWQQFDDDQREACTYRLGNLTLLTAAHNRDAGNAGYAAKRPVYQRSEFAITRRLADDYDTWTPDKIRSRQTWMARQSTTIWRIDF